MAIQLVQRKQHRSWYKYVALFATQYTKGETEHSTVQNGVKPEERTICDFSHNASSYFDNHPISTRHG